MGSLFSTKITAMSITHIDSLDPDLFIVLIKLLKGYFDVALDYNFYHKSKTFSFTSDNFTTDWHYYSLDDWGIQNCDGNVSTLEQNVAKFIDTKQVHSTNNSEI